MRVSPSLPLPNANANFTFGQATIHGWAVFYKSQHSMAFVKPKCVVPGRKLLSYQHLSKLIKNLKTIFRRIGDAVEVKKTHPGHAVR